RFFTRWHEIAHLLTLQGQLELPLHRSRKDESPTERLMDVLAAEVGFYDPIFRPILQRETKKDETLTFETVERIRTAFATDASFHATLNACVKRLDSPMLVVEVGLGLKKDEERQLESRQTVLFAAPTPQPKLRVLRVAANAPAHGTDL